MGSRDVYLSAQNVRRLGSQNPDGEATVSFSELDNVGVLMAAEGVSSETAMLADFDIITGTTSDESICDEWPAIRKKY